VDAIARNARACGLAERVEVRQGRVLDVLPRLAGGAFALAFVDPPYQEGPEGALALLDTAVAPGGRAIAEHDALRPPADRYGALELLDRRVYGSTGISIYRRD
jgi:16S rRNA G966 N2-methylase RsmD